VRPRSQSRPYPLGKIPGFDRLDGRQQQRLRFLFATLPKRQQEFVIAYLKTNDVLEAAKMAGYRFVNPKYLETYGYKLKKQLSWLLDPLIDAQKAALLESAILSRERWLREIERLALADPRKFFDDEGNPVAISQLSDEAAPALAALEVSKDGKGTVTKRIRLADKLKALELYGKATGYLQPEIHVTPDKAFQITVNFVSPQPQTVTDITNTTASIPNTTQPAGTVTYEYCSDAAAAAAIDHQEG
jgi:hypothetical protein